VLGGVRSDWMVEALDWTGNCWIGDVISNRRSVYATGCASQSEYLEEYESAMLQHKG
jgi:hypothetical protein